MATAPAVSIVLPTYNRLAYLQNAVASVLAQTWKDWELLVIDDGSTDGTRAWLSTLQDSRIRVFPRSHSGLVSTLRNLGIAESRGEWIAFLDDDDAWHPEKLQRQMTLHHEHSEFRWSYTAVEIIDGSGAVMPPNPYYPWRPLAGRILEPLLRLQASIASPSVLISRNLLKEVKGLDERLRYSMDYDLWFRLARVANVGVVDERLTFVRSHAGNRTAYQPEVNIAFMESYERFGIGATRRVRRICRERRAYHAVRLARQWLAAGELGAAMRAVLKALQLRPFYPWAWRTLINTLGLGMRQMFMRDRVILRP